MIRALLLGGLLMTNGGCTTPPPGEPEVPLHGAGSCDATGTDHLVGRQATAELSAEAQRLSNARTVRWLKPGQMVTMEYRADRLSISVDEQNLVTKIRCG
jgi:hypothetical protein